MKTQKGQAIILVLVGVVVLVAIAAGAYYFGKSQVPKAQPQTQQPTVVSSSSPDASPVPNGTGETVYTEQSRSANWKTFNSNLGFSFKYPQSFWITSSETRKKDLIEHGDAPPAPQGTVGFMQIITSMVDSADSLINQKIENAKVTVEKTIQVNQYPAKYAELESEENKNVITLLISIQKDNSYAIYLSATNYSKSGEPGIKKEQLISTFNQILSTFRFTQ